MASVITWIKGNPVIVGDVIKYGLALLVLFGVPVPAGAAAAISALIVALGSLVTRSQVSPTATVEAKVEEALYTPVPGGDSTAGLSPATAPDPVALAFDGSEHAPYGS
jgi:hypothetical protein